MGLLGLASVLVLAPVLDEPAPLRLAAVGVGGHEVAWEVDGRLVATTRDGEAARVELGAGRHDVRARTQHDGAWEALARPDPDGEGVAYVQAWTAASPAAASGAGSPASGGEALGCVLAATAAIAIAARLARLPKRP